MTETRTLQFESPRVLQLLYANDLKNLKTLEDSLGVKVTTREGWMKLEGEPDKIDKAQRVFDQLEQARQKGVDIHKHEFNYALSAVNEARDESLGDLASIKIVTSPRKPPIVARSSGQRDYLEAIQKHDVVFGIGPAGTGKTYLAVAMAVAALKKEQAARIILTRPAVEAGEALGFLARGSSGKNHALFAAALRCLARHARRGRNRAAGRTADYRDRAAGLHAGTHVEQRFYHSR